MQESEHASHCDPANHIMRTHQRTEQLVVQPAGAEVHDVLALKAAANRPRPAPSSILFAINTATTITVPLLLLPQRLPYWF